MDIRLLILDEFAFYDHANRTSRYLNYLDIQIQVFTNNVASLETLVVDIPFEPSSTGDVEQIWDTGQRRITQRLKPFDPRLSGFFSHIYKREFLGSAVMPVLIRRGSFNDSRVRHFVLAHRNL